MAKSNLLNTFRSSSGKVFKLWQSSKPSKHRFTTVKGEKGHFHQNKFYGALAHPSDRNVQIPNPDGGKMNVDSEDASKAGRAAHYDKNDINADDMIKMESVDVEFTAKEFKEAYIRESNIPNNDVVQYL